jgi:HEAT repeat protein
VVTQALYALGERKNPVAVQEILRFIKASDHWYCQWYAYKALRKLGWKQIRLKSSEVVGTRLSVIVS